MAPGQGTSQARGITKRWESHVNKSFCSLTLQSQPCLQPIFLPVNTFLAWLCCIPGMPKQEKQEAVGSKLMEGVKPPRRGYLSCLYIPIKGGFMPQAEGQMRQAGFLWEPAISGEMSMSHLNLHRISDLTPHECKVSICLISPLFLSSRSERTSFCCPCSQNTSCDTMLHLGQEDNSKNRSHHTWNCTEAEHTRL